MFDKIKAFAAKEQYSALYCNRVVVGIKRRRNKYRVLFCCPKGHQFEVYWSQFKAGHRCAQCYFERKRKPFKEIQQTMQEQGYILISTEEEYMKSTTKLQIQCSKGHIYISSWDQFQQGRRCRYCQYDNKRKSFTEIKRVMKQEGYEVLSSKYQNSCSKIEVKCPQGHYTCIRWDDFRNGHRCAECAKQIRAAHQRKDTRQVMQLIEQEQYYFVQPLTYSGYKDKFTLQCPKGHQFDTCWNYWQKGHRCPKCSHSQSKGELQIIQYLKSKGVYVIERDRSILGGKELDIFCPNRDWMKGEKK
jgi:hypothetical protein